MTEVKRGPAASIGASAARRWLPWVGGLLGLLALAWVLRSFDLVLSALGAPLSGGYLDSKLTTLEAVWANRSTPAWGRSDRSRSIP